MIDYDNFVKLRAFAVGFMACLVVVIIYRVVVGGLQKSLMAVINNAPCKSNCSGWDGIQQQL